VDTKLRSDHREDNAVSHGGMPVQEFIEEAIQAVGMIFWRLRWGMLNTQMRRERLYLI